MDIDDLSRFIDKVDIREGADCLLWTGAIDKHGYGVFLIGGKSKVAHRAFYEYAEGEISKDKMLSHSCGVNNCVNTNHLLLGIRAIPMSDETKKKISKANKGRILPSKKTRTEDGIVLKQCCKCSTWKPLEKFFSNKIAKDGRGSYCKLCRPKQKYDYEKNKAYILRHKNKDPERYKNKTLMYAKKRMRELYKTSVKHRLSVAMSTRIRRSLKNGKDGVSWKRLVEYSLDDLKNHLELKFREGMAWENYGLWHIDHRKPIASFDYKTPADSGFRECWSLENLQPLWAKENMAKGARYAN